MSKGRWVWLIPVQSENETCLAEVIKCEVYNLLDI